MCRTVMLFPLRMNGMPTEPYTQSQAEKDLTYAEEQLEDEDGDSLGIYQTLKGVFSCTSVPIADAPRWFEVLEKAVNQLVSRCRLNSPCRSIWSPSATNGHAAVWNWPGPDICCSPYSLYFGNFRRRTRGNLPWQRSHNSSSTARQQTTYLPGWRLFSSECQTPMALAALLSVHDLSYTCPFPHNRTLAGANHLPLIPFFHRPIS